MNNPTPDQKVKAWMAICNDTGKYWNMIWESKKAAETDRKCLGDVASKDTIVRVEIRRISK